jgi:hypothetical protein
MNPHQLAFELLAGLILVFTDGIGPEACAKTNHSASSHHPASKTQKHRQVPKESENLIQEVRVSE